MVCSLCGTPNVNKSTCPLSLKSPTKEQWKKHFKAKPPKVSKKKKVQPKSISVVPSTTKYKIPKVPQLKLKHANPYILILRDVYNGYMYFKRKFAFLKVVKIECSGIELCKLNLKIKDPHSFKMVLILNNSKKIIMLNHIKTLLKSYKILSNYICSRLDFFINPELEVAHSIKNLDDNLETLINFLVNNREYKGGEGCGIFSTKEPLDTLVSKIEHMEIERKLSNLPPVATMKPLFMREKERPIRVYN